MDPSFPIHLNANKRRAGHSRNSLLLIRLFIALSILMTLTVFATPTLAQEPTPTPSGEDEPIEPPEEVRVEPTARDEEIQERLARILDATGWFVNQQVEVREGVVFLMGRTEREEYKTWAGNLARNTQDVVAVVNRIELIQTSIWDISPALEELREIGRGMVRVIPTIIFSLLILVVAWLGARFSIDLAQRSLSDRFPNRLLARVAARGIGLIVFLIGLFIVFQVAGLTSIALTVLGGTGLLGLVLGIAFRDITENFLASIFLSTQRPFQTGDLVEIAGITGFVQALTTRATLLMTQDGNHVQIPNSTVYKSNIYNYTSNPNRRIDFVVGISFEDSTSIAQDIALRVLAEHPAVLTDPEPWVLVDNLGSATVNMKVYFWMDGIQHSPLKVKSSVIRLVKRAFQSAGIDMPDESREMIFPEGVPVQMIGTEEMKVTVPRSRKTPQVPEESALVSTDAEDGLSSEAGEIEEQARHSRQPEEGENLLNPNES